MNVIEALRPVTRVFQLLGLHVIPRQKPAFVKYYSILLMSIQFALLCYVSLKCKFDTKINDIGGNKINKVIDVILIVGIHLPQLPILIEAFLKSQQDETFMVNLLEIDRILMENFNIDLKLNELRQSTIKQFFIWMAILGSSFGFVFAMFFNTQFYSYTLYKVTPILIMSLAHFQIFIWADLIRYRLRLMNRLINELKCELKEKVKNKHSDHTKMHDKNAVDDTNDLDQFCMLSDLYNRLWIEHNILNERFKFAMVLNIGNNFSYLVSHLYFISTCLRKSLPLNYLAADIAASIVNIYHLLLLSTAGQHLTNEAQQTAYAIHRNKLIQSSTKLNSFVCCKC